MERRWLTELSDDEREATRHMHPDAQAIAIKKARFGEMEKEKKAKDKEATAKGRKRAPTLIPEAEDIDEMEDFGEKADKEDIRGVPVNQVGERNF